MPRPKTDPLVRFRKKWKLSKEHTYNGERCWEWIAARSKDGYGRFGAMGTHSVNAHRWSYEHFREPIPDGLQLDHLCRVRHCVNPTHLEVVTQQENGRRGNSGKYLRARTHCPQGHPYNEKNTYIHPGGKRRGCRACRREAVRRYQAKRRKAA